MRTISKRTPLNWEGERRYSLHIHSAPFERGSCYLCFSSLAHQPPSSQRLNKLNAQLTTLSHSLLIRIIPLPISGFPSDSDTSSESSEFGLLEQGLQHLPPRAAGAAAGHALGAHGADGQMPGLCRAAWAARGRGKWGRQLQPGFGRVGARREIVDVFENICCGWGTCCRKLHTASPATLSKISEEPQAERHSSVGWKSAPSASRSTSLLRCRSWHGLWGRLKNTPWGIWIVSMALFLTCGQKKCGPVSCHVSH